MLNINLTTKEVILTMLLSISQKNKNKSMISIDLLMHLLCIDNKKMKKFIKHLEYFQSYF